MINNPQIVIPRAMCPQGLIRPARIYRLVYSQLGLHVMYLGRAHGTNPVIGQSPSHHSNRPATRFERRLEADLVAAEEEVADLALTTVFRRKHSFWVSPTEPMALTAIVSDSRLPQLHINARGGSVKLVGTMEQAADFEAIAAAYAEKPQLSLIEPMNFSSASAS